MRQDKYKTELSLTNLEMEETTRTEKIKEMTENEMPQNKESRKLTKFWQTPEQFPEDEDFNIEAIY